MTPVQGAGRLTTPAPRGSHWSREIVARPLSARAWHAKYVLPLLRALIVAEVRR